MWIRPGNKKPASFIDRVFPMLPLSLIKQQMRTVKTTKSHGVTSGKSNTNTNYTAVKEPNIKQPQALFLIV